MGDSDPPKPVPCKKYQVELPDQSIREGMLDANGQARLEDFDPGTCKVSFPQPRHVGTTRTIRVAVCTLESS